MEKRGQLVNPKMNGGMDTNLPTIETDSDYSLRLLSLEDDPSLPILTFRMWFLSLGLSCFGAVLGQIFVSGLYH